MIRIYHNNRCSKSRQTLALLQENGIEPDVVNYLDNPPTIRELQDLLVKLDTSPRNIIRTGEEAYKNLNLNNNNLDDSQLLNAICENPTLLQRPIVVKGNKAIIGRPPENILSLI